MDGKLVMNVGQRLSRSTFFWGLEYRKQWINGYSNFDLEIQLLSKDKKSLAAAAGPGPFRVLEALLMCKSQNAGLSFCT
jgi:hypothetical protein